MHCEKRAFEFKKNWEAKTLEIKEFLEKEKSFHFLKQIKKEFPESEIYLVGGAVRDLFLGKASKDYDFVIRNVEPQKLQEFLTKIGVVNLVGKVFGVFKFVPLSFYSEFKEKNLEPFDLAIPRTEHAYLSGGYRDFEVQSDPYLPIEADLSRRDFTINAIAFLVDENNPKILDPFSGVRDLEEGVIRTVNEPEDRFREDYSRMLRAIRFACQLDFCLEEKTKQTIASMASVLNEKRNQEWIVPRETVAKELIKSFYFNPEKAFELCDKLNIFKVLLPEVENLKNCPQPKEFHSEGDVFTHTYLALKALESEEFKKYFHKERPNAELIFAILFHDLGKPLTLKTPEKDKTDRIRFDEHNEVGASLACEIIERLKLNSLKTGTPYHIKSENIYWLIKNHLFSLQVDPQTVRPATIEKYFFNSNIPGKELLMLTLCDALASLPPFGKPSLENFQKLLIRIEEIGRLAEEKNRLPKPFLNGHEVMSLLNLKPGPEIGKILLLLREKQLSQEIKTKEEAIDFLKNLSSAS